MDFIIGVFVGGGIVWFGKDRLIALAAKLKKK